jgi:putative ABC transport system permease protein
MKTYIMAWRNLWRNRKRTFITMAAITMAVFLSTFMTAMQEGIYTKMIENVVQFYSGYIQIHDTNYWETKSINDIYEPNDELIGIIEQTDEILMHMPRLESFTLLSHGIQTRGSALIGIKPVKENELTNLSRWIIEGEYLKPGDDGLLLTVNLAKNLQVGIGDTLTLLSSGYHGATAAGLFPVRGIIKFASPDLNNLGAYVDLAAAQDFFSAYNKISSTVLMTENYQSVDKVNTELQKLLGENYKSLSWDEMQPEIMQMIEGDKAGAIVFKGLLYILVGFGIFGTVIMMINERMKELAITIAVGMRKSRMQLMMFFETLYIGFLGVLSGFALSIPLISYLVRNPIPLPEDMSEAYETYGFEAAMFFSNDLNIFLRQVIIVFIITCVISIYPVLRIKYLKLIKALHA